MVAHRIASSAPRRIGLVPTMGALHAGHASLIRAATESCARVAVSIFVNPTQFGPHEDFARYPRTFEADCALAQREGADVVFAPAVEEMYPEGATTFVEVEGLSDRLDGESRPGHFRGVATVVSQALHRRGSRPGVLRPERCCPGRGAPPHGRRPAAWRPRLSCVRSCASRTGWR